MYDSSTHLLLAAGEQREREGQAAADVYAIRLVRLAGWTAGRRRRPVAPGSLGSPWPDFRS